MSNVITVIAVQVDTQKAVFIDNTAKRHTVHQTDPALAKLLKELMPRLVADQQNSHRTGKPQKGVQIDLSTYSMYADFEEKTGGLVKFFRAAKAKVASFFEVILPEKDDTTVEEDNIALQEQKLDQQTEVALETVVTEVMLEEPVKPAVQLPLAPLKPRPRYEDMKQDLKPMTTDAPLPDDETLVAVINGVVIPGIDSLKPYIAHALKHNSVKAVTAFLERIAKVIDNKGHSIPDLMQFIERGDLPLADDGSIIAYKILRKTNSHGQFTYVDGHSRNVHQRVGTWVRIPEKDVDPNRANDCSHGLHVARRGYLGSFSGDVCTLIKMPPEDVVAVPRYDANKVRTCSYFIIGELSKHVYDVLRSGKGMFNDPEAAAMLQKAINGEHISVLEEVWVMGPSGSRLEIRNAVDKNVAKKAIKEDAAKVVEATKAASEIDVKNDQVKDDPIDPRTLNQQIKEETAKVVTEQAKTKADLARDAFTAGDFQKVRDIKKAAKVSYERLGFTASEIDQINVAPVVVVENTASKTGTPHAEGLKPKAEPKKKTSTVKGPKNPERAKSSSIKEEAEARSKKGQPKSNSEKPAPKPVPEAVIKAATAPKAKDIPMSTSEIAQDHYLANRWKELYDFKKSKKKSWDYFGFTSKEIAEIEKNKP